MRYGGFRTRSDRDPAGAPAARRHRGASPFPRWALVAFLVLTAVALPGRRPARAGGADGYDPELDGPPSPYARTAWQQVVRALCSDRPCPPVLLSSNPTVPNAVFLLTGSLAKVVYSPKFMDALLRTFGESAALGVLAHELGHHIDYAHRRPTWFESSWDRELQADAMAGCALARLGLSDDGIRRSLRALSRLPSPSHPAWDLRVAALEKGVQNCRGAQVRTARDGGRFAGVAPTAAAYDPTTAALPWPAGALPLTMGPTIPVYWPGFTVVAVPHAAASECATSAGRCALALPIPAGAACLCRAPTGDYAGVAVPAGSALTAAR